MPDVYKIKIIYLCTKSENTQIIFKELDSKKITKSGLEFYLPVDKTQIIFVKMEMSRLLRLKLAMMKENSKLKVSSPRNEHCLDADR